MKQRYRIVKRWVNVSDTYPPSDISQVEEKYILEGWFVDFTTRPMRKRWMAQGPTFSSCKHAETYLNGIIEVAKLLTQSPEVIKELEI